MHEVSLGPELDALAAAAQARRLVTVATVVDAPRASGIAVGQKLIVDEDETIGSLGDGPLDLLVAAEARVAMDERKSRVTVYDVPGGPEGSNVEIFFDVLEPTPQLVIIGAGHIAVPLATYGKILGFEVVVLDDRDKYASVERFPTADRVIAADFGKTLQGFPLTRSSYVVIITRAHTYDEESLRIILDRQWAYLGMIGSRRRVQTVLRILGAEGFDEERLRMIRAPIGLDLASETPEEIALSIMAEVVAVRRGGSGEPLSSPSRFRPIAVSEVAK
ncbi:MAG: hypothetical protein HW416_1902 [Chloroflexi bacterium]|nr:hypothetical protein [Chloroflexota bacterium]